MNPIYRLAWIAKGEKISLEEWIEQAIYLRQKIYLCDEYRIPIHIITTLRNTTYSPVTGICWCGFNHEKPTFSKKDEE